jgi:hypothetical protein
MPSEIAGKLYDRTGREIMRGDIVKVYHFTAAVRRKRHFMYKQALGVVMLGNGDPCPYMKFSHLDMSEDSYHEFCDGRVLKDYEIVQGTDADFYDRPRAYPAKDTTHAD